MTASGAPLKTRRHFGLRAAAFVSALVGVHCSSSSAPNAPASDEGAGAGPGSAAAGGEGGADRSAPEPIPVFNGCEASDYEDDSAPGAARTIGVGVDGLVFTPKCMLIAVGQQVTFAGSFSSHPLAPGNPADPAAGSPDSPIVETSSGSKATFAFAAAGTFPYYCEVHAYGQGLGMTGVVHVRQ